MNYLDDTGDEVMLHGAYKNTTIVRICQQFMVV
jgi:hypothetical protein